MTTEVEVSEPQTNPEVEPTTQDGGDTTPEHEEAADLTPEEIAELKKKAEVSSQNFERAKKAEDELRKLRDRIKSEKKDEVSETLNLSTRDTIALVEAKVSSEDYDEVVRVAKILNKTVADALKDKTMLSILRDRVEERQTAQATQTKSARGSSRVSADALVTKARQGAIPTTDDEIARLAEARQMAKKAKTN